MVTDRSVSSIDDAKKREVIMGSTGVGSYQYIVPTLLNSLADTMFKLITTYTGTQETMLALERGEIQGMMTSLLSLQEKHPEWVQGNETAHTILQVGERRDPSLPDIPLLTDFATNDAQRAIYQFMSINNGFARALIAPAEVPAERVEILRTAFNETMNDPAFQAEAKKLNIPVDWSDADSFKAAIDTVLSASPEVLDQARTLLPQ
jgi:tripartite-type tricarboxylate transporter receptor subunit TctC